MEVSAGTTIGLGFGAAAFLADAELDGEEEDAVSEVADLIGRFGTAG
jgi:hypothetical protein